MSLLDLARQEFGFAPAPAPAPARTYETSLLSDAEIANLTPAEIALVAEWAAEREAAPDEFAAWEARVRAGDHVVQFANAEQIAAEHGQPWGVGKTEAEIDAEVERRVAAWEAALVSETTTEFAAYKAEHPNEYAENWATSLDEYKAMVADQDATRELKIAERVESLELEQEARRRVAAKNYDGLGGLLSWEELEDMGAMSWLVPGWIPMGETSFLVAKRNLGKSMFALALGFSVALGLPFLGEATTPGKVLFVLGEGSRGFIKRLKAWAKANGVDWEDLRESVAVYKGGKINNDQSVADMTEAVRKLNPALVVFDTYSSLSGVVNEIDAAENAEVLNRIKRVAPDAATLILAHPNAETENTTAPKLRGTTVLSSNVDTVITMFRDKNHAVAGVPFDQWLAISTAETHAGKQKDDSNKTLHGLAVLANSEGAYLDYHDAAALSKADAWVTANVALGVTVTVPELVASTGTSRHTVRNHLKESSLVVERASASGGATEYRRSK